MNTKDLLCLMASNILGGSITHSDYPVDGEWADARAEEAYRLAKKILAMANQDNRR